MQVSDTSGKGGLLQDCEQWCNLGDGGITGNTTLKALFINYLNRANDDVVAELQNLSRGPRTDDTNYTDQDFSTFQLETTHNDYQFLEDEDGNSITDIVGVSIEKDTDKYEPLERLTLDKTDLQKILSPNADSIGTPSGFIEHNNTVFLNCIPVSAVTAKLFFKRVPSYFTTSDTTKTPGFNPLFHSILSKKASHRWLSINKSENQVLLSEIKQLIASQMAGLITSAQMSNPVHNRMTAVQSGR